MALIQCHECSAPISDHARTCPKCGAPVIATIQRRKKKALKFYLIQLGFALVMAIIIGIVVNRMLKKAMTPLKAQQQKQSASP